MNKIISLTLLTFLISHLALGQKGNVSTGGVAAGTGGTACYSIGQTDFITLSGNTGTITQGLQQPYEIQIMTGIESADIGLTSSIYPNPTSDNVFLSIANSSTQIFGLILTDTEGKLISGQNISSDKTSISMTGLSNGTYILTVTKNSKTVKSFKIIKNN